MPFGSPKCTPRWKTFSLKGNPRAVVRIRLQDHPHVVFFTGAGLSQESGIPTYRGSGGVWEDYRYQDYACQDAFERDPEKVWAFHNLRREKVAAVEPNPAHRAIASFQAQHPKVSIITQNIDGLHQRAGATQVAELHGSLWRVRCDVCRSVIERMDAPLRDLRCEAGHWLRPDIVWFGDALSSTVVGLAQSLLETADLLVSIGTSGVVFPAADLPRIAAARGARLVEINPEETAVSALYGEHLRMPATQALSQHFEGPTP